VRSFILFLHAAFAFAANDGKLKFLAEQVSHHPPLSVSCVEGNGWTAGETVDIMATYLGNSIEVSNSGPAADRFIHLTATGDKYTWNLPKACVTNLFIGGTFVDHYGTIDLVNETTKTVSSLTLTKCGWFSAGRYQVAGELLGEGGKIIATYNGFWNKYLDYEKVVKSRGEGSMRLWAAGKHFLLDEETANGAFPKFTKFGVSIVRFTEEERIALPPTDSRLRPDRLALEIGDSVLASEEKNRVEEAQRANAKRVEEAGKVHIPKWFRPSGTEADAKWEPQSDYWTYAAALSEEDRAADALW
jgi:Oxysterol-binding protein